MTQNFLLMVLMGTISACVAGETPSTVQPRPDAASDLNPGTADASSVDASSVDASSVDASSVSVTCTTPGLLFCEDFEALAAGPATSERWTNETVGGSLTVDAEHAHGTQALHVRTTGNGRAFIRVPVMPPNNSLYGRMRVWVTEFPSAPDYAHFTMVEAAGAGAGLIRPIGGQYIPAPAAGASLWGTGSDGGPTGDWTNWQTTTPTDAGRWLCVEWHLDAADNNINVWLDGVAKPELSVSTMVHGGTQVDFVFPTFQSVWFGWWLYQSGSTPSQFDLWLDDLALSSTRVGC
jgi:hypothetical protein